MLDEEVEESDAEEGGGEEAGESAAPAAAGGFWGSLKGIITASTGMIVAIGGLITVLANSGVIGDGNGRDEGEPLEAPGEAPGDMPDTATDLTPTELTPTDLTDVSEVDTPEPDAAPTSEPEPPANSGDDGDTRMFVVISRSDGWAAVRSRPTIGSTMLSRLETGDFVRCGRTIDDAGGVPNRFWRYCPEVDGHVAASLLRRVRS